MLKKYAVFNTHNKQVNDELFQTNDFFDTNDLLQVKYEMVRRVEKDGWAVSKAANRFGFSRPTFYESQKSLNQEGLIGLMPKKRGPQTGYKLTEKIMNFIRKKLNDVPKLQSAELVVLIKKKFKVTIHPRTIERALAKRKKKARKQKV